MPKVDDILGDFESLILDADDPPRLGTGIFAVDLQLGGGIPMGRISVIYGPEASMKTTLALKFIAEAQRRFPDKKAVFVDVEGHYSKEWAIKMGVDEPALTVVGPDTAEQAVNFIESLLYAEDLSVVVLDSLAALVTNAELDSDAEKAQVGTQGLLINKMYRKVTRALLLAKKEKKRTPTLILINQIRYKIGVMYGNPEIMPGGPSFLFASFMTLRTYGKDEMDTSVSKDLPAFKKVNVIVKKKKVPIVATKSEFLLALLPNPALGLKVGESYDWTTVLHYLKAYNLLVKVKGGWDLLCMDGELLSYPKQEDLKKAMRDDPEFDALVKGHIISTVLEGADMIPGDLP